MEHEPKTGVFEEDGKLKGYLNGRFAGESEDGIIWTFEEWYFPTFKAYAISLMQEMFEKGI